MGTAERLAAAPPPQIIGTAAAQAIVRRRRKTLCEPTRPDPLNPFTLGSGLCRRCGRRLFSPTRGFPPRSVRRQLRRAARELAGADCARRSMPSCRLAARTGIRDARYRRSARTGSRSRLAMFNGADRVSRVCAPEPIAAGSLRFASRAPGDAAGAWSILVALCRDAGD